MLKISEGKPGKQSITLRLEGRVVGPWVGELQNFCEPLLSNERQLALDLAEVSFVDESGVPLLANLRARGAKLLNATPFVEEQLKSVPKG
jgi:ABC-type transporter Mla MlaB component